LLKIGVLLALLSILIFGSFVATTEAIGDLIGPTSGPQRLWTTDVNGLAEINTFSVGDAVYLKTGDDAGNYPIARGNYTLYLFAGDIFTSSDPDNVLLASYSPIFMFYNITTDMNGRFGKVIGNWATPIKFWDHATPGLFTIVLDQVATLEGDGSFHSSNGIGYWNKGTDYRDDQCTAVNTPPSFCVTPPNVVPEAGTLLLVASMFGAFGCFALVKRRNKYRRRD
jgi:hypothetical protein